MGKQRKKINYLINKKIPVIKLLDYIGLIRVKEEGWTGFSEGRQGCSEGGVHSLKISAP